MLSKLWNAKIELPYGYNLSLANLSKNIEHYKLLLLLSAYKLLDVYAKNPELVNTACLELCEMFMADMVTDSTMTNSESHITFNQYCQCLFRKKIQRVSVSKVSNGDDCLRFTFADGSSSESACSPNLRLHK